MGEDRRKCFTYFFLRSMDNLLGAVRRRKRIRHHHHSYAFAVSNDPSDARKGHKSHGYSCLFLLSHGWHVLFFGISAFVDSSGFRGYSVLFFMAMISLVIKRPYTPQVSKKDYPEAYWNDRTFLAVNNVITVAWAIIFLSNAILCLTARADSRWNSILGPVPSDSTSPFRCKERA